MLGRNHVIVNTSSLIIVGNALMAFQMRYHGPYCIESVSFLEKYVYSYLAGLEQVPMPLWFLTVIACFLLGSLLPDIDSATSTLGRILHVPVEHRTWTHAIWLPMIAGVLSIWYPFLFWLNFGYLLHLFWDALSYGGLCWFYPISKYRMFSGGAKVKQKHKIKLYRTGKTSEYVVVTIIVMLALSTIALCVVSGVYMDIAVTL